MEDIRNLHNLLRSIHGPQGKWWPGTREDIIISVILTQNTNWKNVEKAVANINSLRTRINDNENCLEFLDKISVEELENLIKPSGFYRLKAQRLKDLLKWFKSYEFNFEDITIKETLKLREELLSIKGLGKESVDSILLYAFEKSIFVVDAYTKRLFARMYNLSFKEYDAYRELVESFYEKSVPIYQELHGLIVEHAKKYCNNQPKCEVCPLKDCLYRNLKSK
ncbi:MAG: endonuclease III domain-containing protein [Fervidobacterium sp.]